MRRLACSALIAIAAGCSSQPVASDAQPAADLRPDAGTVDRPTAPGEGSPPIDRPRTLEAGKPDAAPVGLPFSYTRPQVGTPVPQSELAALTDLYLDLLKQTRYFAVLDERLHGWPQSDPKQRYWYGTWWSGVGIHKQAGKISYVHVKAGADNNGLRTGPMLEGACYASTLWGKPEVEALVRRMMRGFTSWVLAMQTQANDPKGTLLSRAAYPEPITSTDGGRTIFIDTSASRPGDDNPASEFVHLPNNPTWGDLYVKNKRSKDDIGHMLRAISALGHCSSGFGAASKQDYTELTDHYGKWARRVEDDAWSIATLDKSAQLWIPPITETLAHFIIVGNAECDAVLALRLLGRADPGSYNCGNAIHPLEFLALGNASNGEILRSFHEAAAVGSILTKQYAAAQQLLAGLAARIEEGLTQYESGSFPVHLNEKKLAALIVLSASIGVPLTWREVRYVHKQIQAAHASYTAAPKTVYRVFDPATPDGDYALEPGGEGLDWVYLTAPIGSCGGQFLNPASNPVFDCARLKATYPTPAP